MYKLEKTWRSIDYPCAVVMNRLGFRCGYVGVPRTHPLFGVNYSEQTYKLWPYWEAIQSQRIVTTQCLQDNLGTISTFMILLGGLKRNSPNSNIGVHGGLTYSGGNGRYPSVIRDHWWFGYDCGHTGDGKDLSVVSDAVREIELMYPFDGPVRSLNYCFLQCVKLADQLREIEKHYLTRKEIIFRKF